MSLLFYVCIFLPKGCRENSIPYKNGEINYNSRLTCTIGFDVLNPITLFLFGRKFGEKNESFLLLPTSYKIYNRSDITILSQYPIH